VGSDIGGFADSASAELYTRWLQTGVFYPFMRSHSEFGAPDKEPWAFGFQFEEVNRHAIELRYRLLPHIYNVMRQASETGLPAFRPLFLEFPEDDKVAARDDQFLFGADLLVAPVLREGDTTRSVYLPKADWYDYWTGRHYLGGVRTNLAVTLDSLPLFVRGGAFIFRQPVVQHTGEMPAKSLQVLIAPATRSEATLYEDDGATLDYRKGVFATREFHQTRDDKSLEITLSAPTGSYRPPARDLFLDLWWDQAPAGVSSATGAISELLPRLDASALEKAPRGWTFADGLLTVKDRDHFEPMRFVIER
jgi:alpha-glucosidase